MLKFCVDGTEVAFDHKAKVKQFGHKISTFTHKSKLFLSGKLSCQTILYIKTIL